VLLATLIRLALWPLVAREPGTTIGANAMATAALVVRGMGVAIAAFVAIAVILAFTDTAAWW
jgi:hypothetical protein